MSKASVTNCGDSYNGMRVCVKLTMELQVAFVCRILISEAWYTMYTLADKISSHSLLPQKLNWFRCCPPHVGQLVKTTVTTAVTG